MSKLVWKHAQLGSQIGSTDNLCDIDTFDANVNIRLGEDSLFAFGVNVFRETDTVTNKQLILASYSPQGEYNEVFIPLDAANTEYASVEEAKAACEDKAEEVIKYLYGQLEILIQRLACD